MYKNNYKSHLKHWESYATVRSHPRRVLNEKEVNNYFFPISKQPVSIHPLVKQKGEKAIQYVLFQTSNNFLHSIAILETEFINDGALMIFNNKFKDFCIFEDDIKYDALSIIIDEAYHAFVAIDFLRQAEDITKIKLLPISQKTTVMEGVKAVNSNIPHKYHDIFKLVAVCIGEHVLTKELITFNMEEEISPTFKGLMQDHVLDESRHAKFFAYVLAFIWKNLPEDYKVTIGTNLPLFLKEYLKKDLEIDFTKQILSELGFNNKEIKKIISDSFVESCSIGINSNNPVVSNMINLLQRSLILDHKETKNAFKQHRLI